MSMENDALDPGTLMALHAAAQGLVDTVLVGLEPADLLRPTPCARWTAADLLAHMLGQNSGLRSAACGGGQELGDWQPLDLGTDPAGRISSSARALVASFARRGLDGPVWMPEISTAEPLPARRALEAHLMDTVVHGWDIASCLGVPYAVPDELLAVAIAVAVRVPVGSGRDRSDSAFRSAVHHHGITPLDSLLADLGRDPGWTPPAARVSTGSTTRV